MSVRSNKPGFTLVEILIVVVILGILAAIVIPQFTSASTDARNNSLTSQVQTLRSQLELYKLQHTTTGSELFTGTDATTNWGMFTAATGKSTGTAPVGATDTACGPYLQTIPMNNVNSLSRVKLDSTVTEATATVVDSAATYGYVYNSSTGKFFGLDKAGKIYLGN